MTSNFSKNNYLKIISQILLILAITFNSSYADVPQSVPTFKCIGLYWTHSSGSSGTVCQVRYRTIGFLNWNDALPLWFDSRDGEYRGSIVNLDAGTTYEIELTLVGTGISEVFTQKTWSEDFPVAQTINLPVYSDQTLVINQSGSPEGYILYTGTDGGTATIDGKNIQSSNIHVEGSASYIIIRNLTLINASVNAIELSGDANDIIIENNDISHWGPPGEVKEGGIEGGRDVERIIIQRNRIHHPNGSTKSWENGHPGGPAAIKIDDSKGQHVIRYNEFYTDFDHYFDDVVTGGSNDSPDGFPSPNSDIYGNYIANCWDDGIQAEGGGKNVRIWGNFIEHTKTHIAIAPVSVGPMYIWNNIVGESRWSHIETDSDRYGRGQFLKTGGDTEWNKGRVYIFHNTMLQPAPPEGKTLPLGGAGGIISSGGDTYEHISRNNIFTSYDHGKIFRDNTSSCTNDLDFDLYYGTIDGNCAADPHESNGSVLSGSLWWDFLDPANIQFSRISGKGEFALKDGQFGIDNGEIIPNFNDNYIGNAPDIGAFEKGSQPMQFGVNAFQYPLDDISPSAPTNVRISN